MFLAIQLTTVYPAKRHDQSLFHLCPDLHPRTNHATKSLHHLGWIRAAHPKAPASLCRPFRHVRQTSALSCLRPHQSMPCDPNHPLRPSKMARLRLPLIHRPTTRQKNNLPMKAVCLTKTRRLTRVYLRQLTRLLRRGTSRQTILRQYRSRNPHPNLNPLHHTIPHLHLRTTPPDPGTDYANDPPDKRAAWTVRVGVTAVAVLLGEPVTFIHFLFHDKQALISSRMLQLL
jgi:hypothetical protein